MQGTDRGRFSCTTRIGNWFEEMVNEDEKMREFLEKKENGQLTIQRIRQNLATVTIPASQPDKYLRYGQPIRIVNGELHCSLACDPGDAENVDEGMYSATGCRTSELTARNVWVIRKLPAKKTDVLPPLSDDEQEDVVRYGDEFVISSTEYLDAKPYYLASHILDWSHFSRVAHKQIVYSTQKYSFACAWRVESIGNNSMMEKEGEPVPVGEFVFLKHSGTMAPLAAHEGQHLNDYGSEYELIANKIPGKKMIWAFQDH